MNPDPTSTQVLPSQQAPKAEVPAAGGTASTGVDADLALRTVMLVQSLLERVVGDRGAEEKSRRSGPRKTYTPRSDVPLSQMATPATLPTRVGRRSLHFSCPCCGRETVVIRRQAGTRLRCPHCSSAVIAPHPRRRLSAHSLERDIDTVLHPEAFATARKPTAPRWVRAFAKEPVLILALAALVPFSAMLMLQVPGVIDRASGNVPTTVAQTIPEPRRPSVVDDSAERAERVVRQYLAASTVGAKAALVRDPYRVAPLMMALAKRSPEEFKPVAAVDVKAAGLSHYQDPSNPVPVTPVVAGLPDGSNRTFFVEHAAEGDVIEWESSTGYSESLQFAARSRGRSAPTTRALWRVDAAPDDYFNRGFADEKNLICLRLTRADSPDDTFWAYAPKDSDVGLALRKIWNESPHAFSQRLTVTVEASQASAQTRQVKLAEVNHAGWRSPDSTKSLVAGNP